MAAILNDRKLIYEGKKQPKTGEIYKGRVVYPYLPSEELKDAVNLAIFLGRPLLIKGEPGCGKTQLALAIAYELGLDFEAWYVKSTSKARDGLYIYDTLGRLRDAQLAASGNVTDEEKNRFENPESYIRFGPLGRAFNNEQPTVVLIDEIDKADIDFPNDLLLELDEKIIKVEELQVDGREMEIKAKSSPIVIITSNEEKKLPDAFLRRCLFHYIKFPTHEQIARIVKMRHPDFAEELVQKAVNRFLELRNLMSSNMQLDKNVSTSELLDWVQALQQETVDRASEQLDEDKLPYLETLLKSWHAHVSYLKLMETE